ncbi:MAG: hypothetical protein JST12_16105 [Armatimonadetes bacterium]|nr:hypothetical protein [Armatimonadota bacterium]
MSYITGDRNVMVEDRQSALYNAAIANQRKIVDYILEDFSICDDPSFGLHDVSDPGMRNYLETLAESKGCKLKEYTWDDLK